jgi:MoxR-like ATPase
MLGVRARALLDGRLAPSVDDVIALAGPVLRHRMAISFAARADGISLDDVIRRLVAAIE